MASRAHVNAAVEALGSLSPIDRNHSLLVILNRLEASNYAHGSGLCGGQQPHHLLTPCLLLLMEPSSGRDIGPSTASGQCTNDAKNIRHGRHAV